MRVEWRAVLDQLRSEINTQPAIASAFTFSGQRRVPASDPRSTPALVQLNAVTSPIFTGIGRSPVPVLLPFDTAAFLDARQNGAPASLSLSRYQADFRPPTCSTPAPPATTRCFRSSPAPATACRSGPSPRPVEVQITGSILIYDLADPLGGKGEPVKSLAAQFPDLRRFIREGYVRYAFTRFGVPYVVSIQCLDSTPRRAAAGLPRGLSGRRAFPEGAAHRRRPAVAAAHGYSVRDRRAAGGSARPISPIARAATSSPAAALANRAATPTSPPIRKSAFRWRRPRPSSTRNPSTQARQDRRAGRRNAVSLAGQFLRGPQLSASANAPAASAIRARISAPRRVRRTAKAPSSCDPRQQAVVAVRDGVVIRSPKQQAATLQINTRTEHIRFRYMHMNPSSMDADGVLNGRRVAEGEKIGVVSNYLDHPNGTSRHLHFDVQVFTRDGWLWVNPYVTLISAYERLIRGRGREIGHRAAVAPPPWRTRCRRMSCVAARRKAARTSSAGTSTHFSWSVSYDLRSG